jgi:hypothetical protein
MPGWREILMGRKNNFARETVVDENFFSRYGASVRRCLLDRLAAPRFQMKELGS